MRNINQRGKHNQRAILPEVSQIMELIVRRIRALKHNGNSSVCMLLTDHRSKHRGAWNTRRRIITSSRGGLLHQQKMLT